MLTRDQELWGIALWVQKHHGADGWLHIAQQQDRLLADGDIEGMALWRAGAVGVRYEQLLQAREARRPILTLNVLAPE